MSNGRSTFLALVALMLTWFGVALFWSWMKDGYQPAEAAFIIVPMLGFGCVFALIASLGAKPNKR